MSLQVEFIDDDKKINSICFICCDNTNLLLNLIKPCLCNTLVHRDCLNKWRYESINPTSINYCCICLSKYKKERVINAKKIIKIISMCIFYVIKDILTVSFIFVTCIAIGFLFGYHLISPLHLDVQYQKFLIIIISSISTGITLLMIILIYLLIFLDIKISYLSNLFWYLLLNNYYNNTCHNNCNEYLSSLIFITTCSLIALVLFAFVAIFFVIFIFFKITCAICAIHFANFHKKSYYQIKDLRAST